MNRLASILLLLALFAGAQWHAQAQFSRSRNPATGLPRNDDVIPPRVQKDMHRRMVRDSFLKMKKETDQLNQLAVELKAEVDKATEDELSLAILKKAESIEKLAEKIKNRMKSL